MKTILGIVVGILILLGAAALAMATGFVQLPGSPQQTNVQGSPPLQPLSAQSSEKADVVVTLSERFFNRQLANSLTQGGQVQSAQIDLHPNNLANITATVQVSSGLRVTPNASVLMGAQDGRLVIEITKVDVAGLSVPNSLIEPQIAQLKQSAETQINRQLAELEKTTGLKLKSLATTENSLTLSFGG